MADASRRHSFILNFFVFLKNPFDGNFFLWLASVSQDKAARLNVPLGFWVFPGDNRSGRFFFFRG